MKCRSSILLMILLVVLLNLSQIPFQRIYADEIYGMDKLSLSQYLLHNEDNSYVFLDIVKHWAKDGMEKLSYMEVLKGFPDGTMKPGKTITRAEFVTMLVRAIDLPITEYYSKYYDDISTSSWSYYHVSAAKKNGLLDIFSERSFQPDKVITREEMAVIASRVVADVPLVDEIIKFKDIEAGYKYTKDIERVSSLGIIKGLPDGMFNPMGNASRAEAAVIIQRILDVSYSDKEDNDSNIVNTSINYEERLFSDANQGNTSLQVPIMLSYGKERKQNYLRASILEQLKNESSISRISSNMEATIISKSLYTSEVKLSYGLAAYYNDKLVSTYKVDKKLYLYRKAGKWVVYNTTPTFDLIYASSQKDVSGKVNLAWHYMYRSSPDMNNAEKIQGLNVISPTWFTLENENGDIKSIADIKYSDWAHENGYKLWALVTNDFNRDLTSKMLNNPEARQAAINHLLAYAEQLELDGINVDFENMYTKDRDIFTQFVKELYEKAKEKDLIISVDVTVIAPYSSWSACYDRAALAKVSDYIMLMAYDQHWAGSPVSGSVAQLSWVENKLVQVLKEVPSNKLVLGLPFYTRLWKEVYTADSNQPIITSKAISMEAAEQAIIENNAVKVWDEQSGQYFITYSKDEATYKMWLEDEKSIQLKVQLVDKYNLAGVASWRLGFEKPEIWNVIYENLY